MTPGKQLFQQVSTDPTGVDLGEGGSCRLERQLDSYAAADEIG